MCIFCFLDKQNQKNLRESTIVYRSIWTFFTVL